ncbi:J domain-containing protein [soil metagenome]
MAVQFKDYYEVLGVSRDADKDTIRKAFRKLARKYHPDTADDKVSAEEKFKEINEAYEVLGDAAKRKKYDALGQDWQHGADFRPPGGAGGGYGGFPGGMEGAEFSFGGTGFSDFFETFFGGRRTRGGGDPFSGAFGGGGGAPRSTKGRDIETDILVTLDEVMEGSVRTLSLQAADGTRKTARVKVPVGVEEGQMIRCAGLGGPGAGGGANGDLYLKVRMERHPDFRVDGSDLIYDLELAPWEAVLGARVPVRTLHGNVNLRVPEGIATGTELRLRSKGLPKGSGGEFGDLYAVAKIVVPESVDAEERALWDKLAKSSMCQPRE